MCHLLQCTDNQSIVAGFWGFVGWFSSRFGRGLFGNEQSPLEQGQINVIRFFYVLVIE